VLHMMEHTLEKPGDSAARLLERLEIEATFISCEADGTLLLEFEVPFEGFRLPFETFLIDHRGKVARGWVVAERSSQAGPHAAGVLFRLALKPVQGVAWPDAGEVVMRSPCERRLPDGFQDSVELVLHVTLPLQEKGSGRT
jgi:hypothetical protein